MSVFFIVGFWVIVDCLFVGLYRSLVVLFAFSFFSLSVYSVFFIGYGSNSSYSFAGMVRSVSQTVSYEVNIFIVILGFCYLVGRYSFRDLLSFQFGVKFVVSTLPLFCLWITFVLSESGRPPFDFSEGESELVSGFNVEYGGLLFAFIFIAEYGMIGFMGLLSSVLFFGRGVLSVYYLFFVCFFLLVRSSYPRYRYDKLMLVSWLVFLPFVLIFLLLVCSLLL
jgi:NADH-ubiquinone oxidoreductase chain 1